MERHQLEDVGVDVLNILKRTLEKSAVDWSRMFRRVEP